MCFDSILNLLSFALHFSISIATVTTIAEMAAMSRHYAPMSANTAVRRMNSNAAIASALLVPKLVMASTTATMDQTKMSYPAVSIRNLFMLRHKIGSCTTFRWLCFYHP